MMITNLLSVRMPRGIWDMVNYVRTHERGISNDLDMGLRWPGEVCKPDDLCVMMIRHG